MRTGKTNASDYRFQEFIRNTTFHGIRYIFRERKPLMKSLWTFIVLISIVLFTYQVVTRSLTYFRYHTNVDVKVLYQESIKFPSVTICNYNSYRLTETVNLKIYDHIVNDDSPNTRNITGYSGSNDDLASFTRQTGHQIEDFIESCIWRGKTCKLDEDVKTTFTDYGACYTFNHNRHTPFYINSTGSMFGLKLVFNIEQYEYVRGGSGAAGIKMLLHDPSEIPLVGDLGFALGPGSYSLVSVRQEQVLSLESPHGSCVKNAPARSTCVLTCRAKRMVKECGCVEAYMMYVAKNETVCSVGDSILCARLIRNDYSGYVEDNCDCTPPCYREVYRQAISHTLLSQKNVDHIWRENPAMNDRIVKKLVKAREMSHRVDPLLSKIDRNIIYAIFTKADMYISSVVSVQKELAGRGNRTEDHATQPEVYPFDLLDALKSDMETLKSLHRDIGTKLSTKQPTFALAVRYWRTLYNRFFYQHVTLIMLKHCAEIEANVSTTRVIPSLTYYSCNDVPYAPTRLAYARNSLIPDTPFGPPRYSMLYLSLNETVDSLYNETTNYRRSMEKLFGNTSEWANIQDSPSLRYCTDMILNKTEGWTVRILDLQSYYDKYITENASWQDKLDVAMFLWNFTVDMSRQLLNKAQYNDCNWYLIDSEEVFTDIYWINGIDYLSRFVGHLHDNKQFAMFLTGEAEVHRIQFKDNHLRLFAPFADFLNNESSSKSELHLHATTTTFIRGLSDLTGRHDAFVSQVDSFLSRLQEMENVWQIMSDNLLNVTIPLMTHEVTQQLSVVRQVMTAFSFPGDTSSPIFPYFASMGDDLREVFTGVGRVVFAHYRLDVRRVVTQTRKEFVELSRAVRVVQERLREFNNSLILSEKFVRENFIKCDVFYEELSVKKIEQQISFKFFSLLSEIGGMLGLLLGASVLTVCEVIDYVSLKLTRRCHQQRNGNREDFSATPERLFHNVSMDEALSEIPDNRKNMSLNKITTSV